MSSMVHEPVDAVVAWVDGGDPVLAAKRGQYSKEVEKVAKTARRFSDNEEIRYCIRSIRNFAPWIRNIWLITDNQFPSCFDRDSAEKAGIHVVDHQVIFRGFEALLPTFNSLSIETMLWRIPGLADKFIYFNDDMMVTAPTTENDFFVNGNAVLRGSWVDRSDQVPSFHGDNKLAAARLCGHDASWFFSSAHVPYPMHKSILEAAYNALLPEFARNAAFRFRNRTQFWPVAIHAYFAIQRDRAEIFSAQRDWEHFSVNFCKVGTPSQTARKLDNIANHRVKLACINYFEKIEEKVPAALSYLERATGARLGFEK